MSVRRVVVAIDCGEQTERIVKEAVRVASRMDSDIEGLFVEDAELLALAAHSFAHRVGAEGQLGDLTARDLEREWRVIAAQVRRSLERAAAHLHVRSRFAVERGPSRESIRERLEQGDVVVVGWGGWSPRASRSAPVRVLYDATDAADRALDVGVRLCGEGGTLAVWLVGGDDAALDAMRARLEGQVGRIRLAPMGDPSVAAIRHILSASPGGLLVLPSGSDVAEQLAARSLAARFPAGVLVVH